MAIVPLRVTAPQSPYRDCDIAMLEAADPAAPARAMCIDAETGLIIGSPSLAPGHRDSQRIVNADEVIRLIGGTYRLASIAVEIGTNDLAKQSRRISDELRLRPRLWRRKRRPSRS
ncbi:hypothetical protein ACFFWD_31205 [Bradyrhizobium erythrophlei]|uniref:hypothetical protein n=1 Tax=Bradyrhizobium erythrophlei TaxID=1437360 RepID=UPI0035EB856C